MNTFSTYWKQEFNNLPPFGHELRHHFPKRWFRIHSLPKSKRYADTAKEYQLILDLQNELFTAVFEEGTEIFIVFGFSTNDITNDNYIKVVDFTEFEKVDSIDFHQIEPKNYDEKIFLELYAKYEKWHKNRYNKILKAIADDEVKMLFICPSKNRIIIPYDGGVDVIMENQPVRDEMKIMCKGWLSDRKDGL